MTMVERAVAAWRKEASRWGSGRSPHDGTRWEIYRHSNPGIVSPVVEALVTFDKELPTLNELRDVACMHAAIKALREPTEGMIDVGSADCEPGSGGVGDDEWRNDVKECWRAMIDAALSET